MRLEFSERIFVEDELCLSRSRRRKMMDEECTLGRTYKRNMLKPRTYSDQTIFLQTNYLLFDTDEFAFAAMCSTHTCWADRGRLRGNSVHSSFCFWFLFSAVSVSSCDLQSPWKCLLWWSSAFMWNFVSNWGPLQQRPTPFLKKLHSLYSRFKYGQASVEGEKRSGENVTRNSWTPIENNATLLT